MSLIVIKIIAFSFLVLFSLFSYKVVKEDGFPSKYYDWIGLFLWAFLGSLVVISLVSCLLVALGLLFVS